MSAITKPIKTLADFSRRSMEETSSYQDNDIMSIRSPVYEVRQLYYQGIDHLRMLNKQVNMDGLTGIANRRLFDVVIEKWMEEDMSFSLIMLDIDFFKKVNDTHGHLVGDQVLIFLANQMLDHSSEEDLCFRYGGEEFGILVKNEGESRAYELAERLRTSVANTPSPTGDPIEISLGVTSFQGGDEQSKEIVDRADLALYHSKQTGRNNTTLYHPSMK